MDDVDARALIAPAVRAGESWADLGVGTGTFTRALASLAGASGQVYAMDRDHASVAALRELSTVGAHVTVEHADFTADVALPNVDGVLLANALHFVDERHQVIVLARVARCLRPGGRVVVVEYDNRPPSRWVPYPISFSRLAQITRDAGFALPMRIGEIASAYSGTIYAAMVDLRSVSARTLAPSGT